MSDSDASNADALNSLDADVLVNTPKPVEEKKALPKWVVPAGIAAAVVVVLAVAGAILLPRIFGMDYAKAEEVTLQLKDQLEDIYDDSSSACYKMGMQISSSKINASTYTEYTDECQQMMLDARDKIVELGEVSAIKNDKDLKAKYDVLAEKAAVSLPDKAKLEQTMEFCRQIHDFLLAAEKITADSSADQVRKASEPLINSGNEVWANFAKEWRDFMIELLDIVAEQKKGNVTQALYNRYVKVMEEYEDWTERSEDVAENIPVEFDSDVAQELIDAFNALERAVVEKAN